MPFVVQTGWDPTTGPMPRDGDHGPYRRLTGHRLSITSADPTIHKSRSVFSYTIKGKTLTLHVRAETDPTLTPDAMGSGWSQL